MGVPGMGVPLNVGLGVSLGGRVRPKIGARVGTIGMVSSFPLSISTGLVGR